MTPEDGISLKTFHKIKAIQHFNGLTPAEAERLALLSEELGEAQQAIGKILRHGYDSSNPVDPGRFKYFEELGADSIDGTGLSRFSWMREDIYKAQSPPPLFADDPGFGDQP